MTTVRGNISAEAGKSPFLGFALVTHACPEQIAFLCRKLSTMFGNPPIAIHHDYSKCHLDPSTLPPQVRIVSQWIQTSWGSYNLVEAYLAALRLLYENGGPEWVTFLSAADYPIKSADYILEDLRSTHADAFLDYREIRKNGTEPPDARSHAGTYKQPSWMKAACGRYLSYSVVHYHLRRLVGRENQPVYLSNALITRFFTPFSRQFRPFGGDTWHTLNRKAARVLLEDSPRARKLQKFYRKRIVPDESYWHTMLLNRPELHIENDNRRYTIWVGEESHPRTLRREDVSALVRSTAHFGRKFPFDEDLYQLVDEEVDAMALHQS